MSKYCIEKDDTVLYLDCQECEKKICEYFFCLVVGSRDFNDYSFMKQKLDYLLQYHKGKVVIVSGGAKGADTLAERYAKENNYPMVVMKAEWNKYGNAAGFIRNRKMQEYISKADKRGVVAFWKNKSKGTAHNFELAEHFNNPIRIYEV